MQVVFHLVLSGGGWVGTFTKVNFALCLNHTSFFWCISMGVPAIIFLGQLLLYVSFVPPHSLTFSLTHLHAHTTHWLPCPDASPEHQHLWGLQEWQGGWTELHSELGAVSVHLPQRACCPHWAEARAAEHALRGIHKKINYNHVVSFILYRAKYICILLSDASDMNLVFNPWCTCSLGRTVIFLYTIPKY